MNKLFLSLSLLLFSTFSFGWWNTGHATVCQIAENHLTPEVKAEVEVDSVDLTKKMTDEELRKLLSSDADEDS